MAVRPARYGQDEDNGWATVVALDPGGTTGWSVICVEEDALSDSGVSILKSIVHWAQGEVDVGDEDEHAAVLVELLAAWPNAACVIEDFFLRKFLKDKDLLSPVRITSKIEYAFRMGLQGIDPPGRNVFKQQPSMAMSTATDARLHDWGLYVREGGFGHARDATRHAITFLRRAGDNPLLRNKAWPGVYGKDGAIYNGSEMVW